MGEVIRLYTQLINPQIPIRLRHSDWNQREINFSIYDQEISGYLEIKVINIKVVIQHS